MKHNNNHKFLSALIIISILASTLISCGSKDNGSGTSAVTNKNVSNDTTVSENTTNEIREELPDKNYDGYEFRIYNGNVASNVWFTTTLMTAEEETGDTINDAIYKRNLSVEEKFNVKIKETEVNGIAGVAKKSIMAGDDVYDVGSMVMGDSITFASSNLIYEYGNLPYVDLDKPWWDSKANKNMSIGNKLFFTVSDLDTTHLDETITIFFNKSLIQEYDLPNPYELVKKGEWTIDKIGEMGKKVIADLDGNTKYDENDRYAYMSHGAILYPYLILGSGENFVQKDENDIPYFAMSNPRFMKAYEKVVSVLHSEGDNFLYNADLKKDAQGLGHRMQEIMFPAGRVLFWTECVSWSKSLRNMEFDFGILPPPKLDVEQKDYFNYCNNPYVLSIPVTNKDLERTSVILEALSAESSRTVVPAYYDVMLKGKYTRDNESSEMLDIIFDSLTYDIGIRYWDNITSAPLIAKANKNDLGISSLVAANEAKAKAQIEKTVKAIQELE